jgi:outer membrane protein TolC
MDYLPDFQIGAQWIEVEGGTNPMFSRDGEDIWVASLGLSIPLWIGRIRAGVEESQASLLERESAQRELQNRVLGAVRAAFEQVNSAALTEEIFRTTLIPQTEERISASRAGYETGLVDFLNLIDALRSLERVSLDRHRAVREHQHALADLERAVGANLSNPPEKKL